MKKKKSQVQHKRVQISSDFGGLEKKKNCKLIYKKKIFLEISKIGTN